jgi:hypothetical protein
MCLLYVRPVESIVTVTECYPFSLPYAVCEELARPIGAMLAGSASSMGRFYLPGKPAYRIAPQSEVGNST